jgi:hypothetical protein
MEPLVADHNSVTMFSNDQAHLRIHRKVEKGGKDTEISLPFRQSSMEDVLAFFGVFGNVRYTKSFSFPHPSKNAAITIDPTNPLPGLLKAFAGAKVEFKRGNNTVTGVNFVISESEETTTNGVRYAVKVPAKGKTTMTVAYDYIGTQSMEITDPNWFLTTFVMVDDGLQNDKKIKTVLAAAKKVAGKQKEIAGKQAKITKATNNKNHYLQIVQVGANAGNLGEYQKELQTAMQTIKDEGDAVEKLQDELSDIQGKLHEAVRKLSGELAYVATKDGGEQAEELVGAGSA